MEERTPIIAEEETSLKRDVGLSGSFFVGYAGVGADIYVALGLVIFFALGAAPLALAIAGVGFVFTALSYAELASAVPVAGGASSFSREAFGDFAGFLAGWGLLLDYTIDIALFAWFTMGYLGGFTRNLANAGYPALDFLSVVNFVNANGDYTFQAIGTAVFIFLLIGLNIIGIKESVTFNVITGALDIVSEAIIIGLGLAIAWSGSIALSNVAQLGTTVSWSNFGFGITIAVVSYIGLETMTQVAEETKNPGKVIPRAIIYLIVAILVVALTVSTLAVGLTAISPSVLATTYQADPIAGVAKGVGLALGAANPLSVLLPLWAGILGFSIVAISANTGVIGASRVTYSMAKHNIFPRWFSYVQPRLRVPLRTIVTFSLAALGFIIFVYSAFTFHLTPEDPTIILADVYSYGALIAFMLSNLSLIRLRSKRPELFRPFRSPLTLRLKRRSGGVIEIPTLALLGFLINATVWILVLGLHQVGRVVGTLWFVMGILGYYLYRRQQGLKLNKPIEGTLLTTPENAPKLHPEVFDLPVSIDVVMEADKEKEELEESGAIERGGSDIEGKSEEETAQPEIDEQSNGSTR